MAILLGEKAHLIEFPSILLPPGATTGSIVNIAVHQNHTEEQKREREFWDLQDDILEEFGQASPEAPKLSVRNVTQTSVTLEWPSLKLATAKLRSLDIYRNNQRLSSVPSPLTNTSTKHSGMDINTEYTFQLILRTTAGTFPSKSSRCARTLCRTPRDLRVLRHGAGRGVVGECKLALRDMGAKWSERIQIDTSHFVCTTPAGPGGGGGAPGAMYQRALQLSIPVVQPHWILACHAEKRMVPIASFYLGAPSSTPSTAGFNRPQSMSQASLPRSPSSPQPNQQRGTPASYRASMPPPSRSNLPPGTPPSSVQSAFVNQQQLPSGPSVPNAGAGASSRPFEATPEEEGEEVKLETQAQRAVQSNGTAEKRKSRMGSMNKEFKFPVGPVSPGHGDVDADENEAKKSPPPSESQSQHAHSHSHSQPQPQPLASTPEDEAVEGGKPPLPSQQSQTQPQTSKRQSVINPANIEVPAPPPVEKERRRDASGEEEEEEGDEFDDATVEISLN
ncbi:hypothetical protein CPB84DRAFT_791955 [Gymnopilus junonius]|uniref:Uncharacterized protein n=1 Tax=Gymnopilus junonius TaxID=109634 RepID=A0A9P5N9M0_GYMJU|nr:hypothetical protein CPB84DRAFT_791955 [Gymnopilus junonius]